MEKKHDINEVRLLPRYFFGIGLAVIFAVLLAMVFAKVFRSGLDHSSLSIMKETIPSFGLLGLLFIALSKDKTEDERTLIIRLKAMSWVFVWGVGYVIIDPLLDRIFGGSIHVPGGRALILSMLFIYLLIYYLFQTGR